MDTWWAELEVTLSLKIQDQHKAELEELTGCTPILLRPLQSPSQIISGLQSADTEERYAEMVEHLFTTLEKSDEVRNVRKNILAFVADKSAKLSTEPVKWYS
jgi:hypothetical protein